MGLAYDGCSPKAFLYTNNAFTELAVLGAPFGTQPSPPNRATVISDDGSTIAGWAANGPVDRSPAIWRRDGTGFLLDPNDMDAPGEILSISPNGQVVAGIWSLEGFRFSEAGGREPLGRLPDTLPFDGVYPNAMARDGDLIFGTNGMIAFVWTPSEGMRPLLPLLKEKGLEVAETIALTNVLRASTDGTVLIGSAVDNSVGPFGLTTGFILRMPADTY
jgi:hypothetical protein